ncbi:MAG: hypothetical protein ACFB4I_04590 [Cyanophyceae cyanobacterium]
MAGQFEERAIAVNMERGGIMPTAEQAIKAAILCQFLTGVGLPITVFYYDASSKLLYLEAAGGNEFKIVINQQGKARNV